MASLLLAPNPSAAGLGEAEARALEAAVTAWRGSPWGWSYDGVAEEIASVPEGALAALQAYARSIGAQAPHLLGHDPDRGVFLPEPFDVPAAETALIATSAARLVDELDALNARLGCCQHFADQYFAHEDLPRMAWVALRDAIAFALARKLPLALGGRADA